MTLLDLSLPGSHPRLCHSLATSDKLVHRGEGHCQTERNQGPCLETKRNSGKAQILTPIKKGRGGAEPSRSLLQQWQVSSSAMPGITMFRCCSFCVDVLKYGATRPNYICCYVGKKTARVMGIHQSHDSTGFGDLCWFCDFGYNPSFFVCWIIHYEERIHVTLQSTCILIFVNKLRSWCTQRVHVFLFVWYMVIHVCVNNQTYISREIFIFYVKS